MNDELTKITLTFPIRCDRPNRNGTVFTEEAIRNAFASSNPHMPIIVQGGTNRDAELPCFNDRVIGYTDPTYYFDYDDENKVCNATLTGRLFNMAPDIVINKMHDGKITDFEIRSVSIVK
jgi:hypothetical protein